MRFSLRREKTVHIKELRESLKIVHGSLSPDILTLFMFVRDEMFFMPAFLDYHRKLGIKQFLVFDDRSQDGTYEYLKKQQGVAIMHSSWRYGDRVKDEHGRTRRVGLVLKEIIPQIFLHDQFHIYLDADEFLFLPPQVERVGDVLEILETEKRKGVAASVVEFFPNSIREWDRHGRPATFEELSSHYPFFEPFPLIECDQYGKTKDIGRSKTEELFRKYISKDNISYLNIREWLLRKRLRLKSCQKKVPICYTGDGVFRDGSHEITAPVSSEILLTIGHFVFTANFEAKVEAAVRHKSHVKRGAKYNAYKLLIDQLREGDGCFLSDYSTRLEDVSQLVEAGLMRWPGLSTSNSV